MEDTFFGSDLPDSCISFLSSEGKRLFAEALQEGYLEAYFPLAAHFTTQANTGFCGLASLTVALNALRIDPHRAYSGVWRYFDEVMLDCCDPLEKVTKEGIGLKKVACLALCNGATVEVHYGTTTSLSKFRADLLACLRAEGTIMVVSYSREVLGQVGVGHFSPMAGYHNSTDRVLILDVARFKYPPHWVKVEDLYAAMCTTDTETGDSRGYLLIRKDDGAGSTSTTTSISACAVEQCEVGVCQGADLGERAGLDESNAQCVNHTYVDMACVKRQQEKMAGLV
eukprot:gene26345-31824_t